MKILVLLSALVALAAGQGLFGGLGGALGGLGSHAAGGLTGGLHGLPFVSSIGKIANVANLPLPGTIANFADFVSKTGKKYATQAEQTFRENIFLGHQHTVEKYNSLFNAGHSTFELGLNFLSDLSPAEFLKGLCGRKKSADGDAKVEKHKTKALPPASVSDAIPDSFDWREKGGVTPVKFQGLECGACWSFAVTGAIEGHIFRKTGELVNLSEQNLVDCGNEYGNTGCDGGFQDYGFEYVIENKGISKADSYPYIEKQESCKYDANNRGSLIDGYSTIPPGNETRLKEVIATLGPVAASVNAEPDSFQLYKGGIYNDKACNDGELNHSILIVGYGTEEGQDYWIIKNSWTDKWGDKGFMKILRNANNFCGIASECSYPVEK